MLAPTESSEEEKVVALLAGSEGEQPQNPLPSVSEWNRKMPLR